MRPFPENKFCAALFGLLLLGLALAIIAGAGCIKPKPTGYGPVDRDGQPIPAPAWTNPPVPWIGPEAK